MKVKTPEGGTRYALKPLAAELSFDKGLFVFVRAVQLLTHHNKDIILVRPSLPHQTHTFPPPHPATPLPSLRWAWLAPLAPARPPLPAS